MFSRRSAWPVTFDEPPSFIPGICKAATVSLEGGPALQGPPQVAHFSSTRVPGTNCYPDVSPQFSVRCRFPQHRLSFDSTIHERILSGDRKCQAQLRYLRPRNRPETGTAEGEPRYIQYTPVCAKTPPIPRLLSPSLGNCPQSFNVSLCFQDRFPAAIETTDATLVSE
jgi:hypothetical protein